MTVKRSNVAKWLFKTDLVDNFKRKITGGFWNSDPSYPYKPHAGVDYGADLNEVLVAYDDYEVIGINTGHEDYGQHVFLYFPLINKTGLYAHLNRIDVKLGQKGSKQTAIGLSGNTGKSQGPHLHFGLANGKVTSTNKGNSAGEIWLDYENFNYSDNLVNNPSDNKLVAQNGIFIPTGQHGSNVREGASIDSKRVDGLAKGVKFNYTHYIDSEGYRWVTDGKKYIARRKLDNSEIYGDAVLRNVAPKPTPKPVTNVGKYANLGGKTWLFKVARTDETYPNGYSKLTDLRNRSAKILADDNGRVKISVPSFRPNVVWVAKSQISITDKPKHSVN